MTNEQIKRLLQQALRSSNTTGTCYDVGKLVIQIQLIISMLDSNISGSVTHQTEEG